MKKLLATTALAAFPFGALAADLPKRAPAPAPAFTSVPAFDAFGSVAVGYSGWDDRGRSADGVDVAARATFYSTLSGAFGFQLDGVFERPRYDFGTATLANNTGSLAGHLFWRNSNTGLFGVIAQGNAKSNDFSSDRHYFLGLEAQYFIGNVTLYGQVAYQNLDAGAINANANGFALAGQVRYFATTNLMLALKGGYSSLDFGGAASGSDHTAWTLGGKAEYRFAASPISLFAEADYRRGMFRAARDETDTRVMVGAKWNFGSQTLFQRDRSGGSLDPFRSLAPPTIWAAGSGPS